MAQRGPEPTLQERYQALYDQMASNAQTVVEKFPQQGADEQAIERAAPQIPLPSIDQLLADYQPLATVREGYGWSSGREATPEEQEAHKNQFLDAKIKPLLEAYERDFGRRLTALESQFSFHGTSADRRRAPQFAPIPGEQPSEMEGVLTSQQYKFGRGAKGTINAALGSAFQYHQEAYAAAQRQAYQERMGRALTDPDPDYQERNSNPLKQGF